MPLPTAVPRKHMHTRDIQCCGYERDDGLWDIEGHLVDTKAFSTTARDTGRARQAGEPIHNMWLRLTIDLDMKIHDVEAVTDASPYQLCPTITPNVKKLIGITIGPGGRVASASVVRPSGFGALDDAARQIVRSISPPPPPGGSFSASTTIRFHVE